MSNEQIKEIIANKRENYKLLAVTLLALLTGVTTNIYQVITHKVPLYSIIFSGLGMIIAIQLVLMLRYIAKEIDELIKGL